MPYIKNSQPRGPVASHPCLPRVSLVLLPLSQTVKTTPQKTRFRDVKYARLSDTDGVDDHSDRNTIDDTKHKIHTKHNTKPDNVCSDLKTLGEHVIMRVVVAVQSRFCCCHTHPLHIAHLAQDVCVCVSFHHMVITMSHA